jgi:hypothetical protein
MRKRIGEDTYRFLFSRTRQPNLPIFLLPHCVFLKKTSSSVTARGLRSNTIKWKRLTTNNLNTPSSHFFVPFLFFNTINASAREGHASRLVLAEVMSLLRRGASLSPPAGLTMGSMIIMDENVILGFRCCRRRLTRKLSVTSYKMR